MAQPRGARLDGRRYDHLHHRRRRAFRCRDAGGALLDTGSFRPVSARRTRKRARGQARASRLRSNRRYVGLRSLFPSVGGRGVMERLPSGERLPAASTGPAQGLGRLVSARTPLDFDRSGRRRRLGVSRRSRPRYEFGEAHTERCRRQPVHGCPSHEY